MILTRNGSYWSVGINVRWSGIVHVVKRGQSRYVGGWFASLNFLDDGFCNDDVDNGAVSTQGTLTTRYYVSDGERVSGLSAAVDALIEDAGRLGIRFKNPHLTYVGDGEDPNCPPPEGWEALLDAEARRIGWEPICD